MASTVNEFEILTLLSSSTERIDGSNDTITVDVFCANKRPPPDLTDLNFSTLVSPFEVNLEVSEKTCTVSELTSKFSPVDTPPPPPP